MFLCGPRCRAAGTSHGGKGRTSGRMRRLGDNLRQLHYGSRVAGMYLPRASPVQEEEGVFGGWCRGAKAAIASGLGGLLGFSRTLCIQRFLLNTWFIFGDNMDAAFSAIHFRSPGKGHILFSLVLTEPSPEWSRDWRF